jgi:hypothetical protein
MFEEAQPWPHRPLRAVGPDDAAPPDRRRLMDLVGELAGEWTDHPECVHPTLGAVARGVYEHSSEDARAALMPLAPSLLDTVCKGLDLSARIVATCASTALASPVPERIDADHSRRLEAARRTAFYLMARERASGSVGDGADAPRMATRTWVHLLQPFGLTEPWYRRVVSSQAAAEAVVVVARASGDARDERLSQLLRWCIDLARRRVGGRTDGMRGKPGARED